MRALDYDIPDELYYSKEHEWVKLEGKEAVVKWIELMAPGMYKLEQDELDARAKKMVWDELKK